MTSSRTAAPLRPGRVPRSRRLLIACWLLFAVALAFSLFALAALPGFDGVLGAFGTQDLPALTRAVFDYRWALLLLPLLSFVPALLVSLDDSLDPRVHRACQIGLLLLSALLCAAVAAVIAGVYLPILRLTDPV